MTIQEEELKNYKKMTQILEKTIEFLIEWEVKDNKHQNVAQTREPVGSRIHNDDTVLESSRMQVRRANGSLGLEPDGQVAFHAVIRTGTEVTHIGLGQNIIFPDVLFNLGGGYRSSHGIFNAPIPGIYLFYTSIMTDYQGHMEISVILMKNGAILARAYGHGDSGRHDQGSVTVVTALSAGDQMWVSMTGPADTSLWGDSYDSFTGVLVIPV